VGDEPARSQTLASETLQGRARQSGHSIPAISASPLPHLDRCAAAYREEYGGNEYGGLPVNYAVYGDAQRVSSSSKAEECHYRPLDLYELLRR
jgi:hypothetical protein